ncbi:MAG: radical SAM protein [Elusimicrobiota bacterium]
MIKLFNKIRKKINAILLRVEDRNFLTLIKLLEIKLLGKYASTYCYNFPSHVLIEVTTRCNLQCPWCQQSEPSFRKENYTDIPFEKVLNMLPHLKGVNVLLLYNIGEPLLYPHLFEVIREAKKIIPQVRITTNGVLLTEENILKLKNAGLTQLNVSIDSPDPDIFFKIRGVELGRIRDNIEHFCNLTDIPLHIWSVISNQTVHSLKMLPEFAASLKNCRQLYFQLVRGFQLNDKAGMPIALTEHQFNDLKQTILEKCTIYGLRSNLEYIRFYPPGFFNKEAKGICPALFTTLIAINNRGYINPCCSYRSKSLDSVIEIGFKEAWNGAKVRKWRRLMLEQKYPEFCSNWCGYLKS